jgi:hypothetical protein
VTRFAGAFRPSQRGPTGAKLWNEYISAILVSHPETDGDFMNVEVPEHETASIANGLGAEESYPGPVCGNLWRDLHLLPAGCAVFVRSHLGREKIARGLAKRGPC